MLAERANRVWLVYINAGTQVAVARYFNISKTRAAALVNHVVRHLGRDHNNAETQQHGHDKSVMYLARNARLDLSEIAL